MHPGGKLRLTLLCFSRIVKSRSLKPSLDKKGCPLVQVVALIPARYGSTRFPGKPLALLRGKPMIQHVYEQTRVVRGLARVIVATDDERIAGVIRTVGGEVAMTRADHPTGTDRLAEVAERLSADI